MLLQACRVADLFDHLIICVGMATKNGPESNQGLPAVSARNFSLPEGEVEIPQLTQGRPEAPVEIPRRSSLSPAEELTETDQKRGSDRGPLAKEGITIL